MPCDSSYMEPSKRERDSLRIRSLLKELKLPVSKGDECYGDVSSLDKDVRTLCAHLGKLSKAEILNCSLELQIFWRDHQKADKDRRIREAQNEAKELIKQKGLAKLTPAEKKALGLK